MTVRLPSMTITSGDGETSVSSLATPDGDGPHPALYR
jgi:hypothetical protein